MHLLIAYVHIVSAVLLTGYALFWLVMTVFLGRSERATERAHHLETIAQCRFPPSGVPEGLRVPIFALGWLFLAVLILSGLLLAGGAAIGMTQMPGVPAGKPLIFAAKMILLVLAVIVHSVLVMRRAPLLACGLFALVTAMLVLSAVMVR